MPTERKKIVKPYLLLCEGRDAAINVNIKINSTPIYLPAMNMSLCSLDWHQAPGHLIGRVMSLNLLRFF